MSGYKIDFVQEPHQASIPKEIPFSADKWNIVNDEVLELLKKGAIVETFQEEGEFLSNIFIVPKPNGKQRPVINLKHLNQFVQYNHFKQETFSVVLDSVQRNDFFTKINLREAYFSVPICEEDTKYLKFSWNGKLYRFVCLPFGLSIACYLITKILKPIFARFRAQNIRCCYYIDDSINMNQNKLICLAISQMLLSGN